MDGGATTIYDAGTERSLATTAEAGFDHHYRWDAQNRKIVDVVEPRPPARLQDYVAAPDEVSGLTRGLVNAIKTLRATEDGKVLSDLLLDDAYRAEFDAGVDVGQSMGLNKAFANWRDDYLKVLPIMLRSAAILFGDPDAAAFVTATMVYELFARPALELLLGDKLPPAWDNPKVKALMRAVRANAPTDDSGQPVQPEFRRMARSILNVFAFLDLLHTFLNDPKHGLFLMGFSENTFSDVATYAQEWLDSLTARAATVASLMLELNGQPGDQGATIGYWMGATIGNTVRAGVEELLRFQAGIG